MFELPTNINIDVDYVQLIFQLIPLIIFVVILIVVILIVKKILSNTN